MLISTTPTRAVPVATARETDAFVCRLALYVVLTVVNAIVVARLTGTF